MYELKEYFRLRNGVLVASIMAWIALLAGHDTACHCPAMSGARSWDALLAIHPPIALAGGWALMLAAMMAPMLVPAMFFIYVSSFARHRLPLMALFAASYGLVWMAAGGVLTAIMLVASFVAPHSYWPALFAGFAAFVWQASPIKQICLNRCHSHRPMAAFGPPAYWAALRMGLEHGIWCAGSCWLLMLFPMLLPSGHNLAMLAVTALMICERMDPGAVPAWRLRGFRKASLRLARWLRGPRTSPMPLAPALRS